MIKRFELHEAIVDEIKGYIHENKLKSGDRLPNQQKLSELFGVSRTSLRESLRTLQALQVIDIINGKGIFVKTNGVYKASEELNIEDKRKTLLDFLEVRSSIEGLAIKLAAERITDEEIKELEKNVIIIQEKGMKGEENPVEDREFHYGIFKAAKNPILLQALKSIYDTFEIMWENPLGMGPALTAGSKWHVDIFNHIKNHEAEKAEKVFQELIEEIRIIAINI